MNKKFDASYVPKRTAQYLKVENITKPVPPPNVSLSTVPLQSETSLSSAIPARQEKETYVVQVTAEVAANIKRTLERSKKRLPTKARKKVKKQKVLLYLTYQQMKIIMMIHCLLPKRNKKMIKATFKNKMILHHTT